MVALSARTGGSRHTGLAALPHENNQYTSLSAGEKILAIVLMTDLVNLFSGSGFLIIDDTDHLDEDSFEILLKFVTDQDIQEQYDNIIISSVNHSDILNKIKDYDVDHIEM